MPHTAVTIITPCYNEGEYATRFLQNLEQVLAPLPYSFCVLVVDDASTDNTLALLRAFRFQTGNMRLEVASLRFNLGHQGAIYQGFLHAATLPSQHFIVMDSDGEDAPTAIPAMLRHLDADIVHAVRNKRKESLLFRLCYYLYKAAFRWVTGKNMNFGNYCLISRRVLEQAIHLQFAHFAAFLSRQRCPVQYIVADREERIGGKSKMGFKKLFYHAFRSFVEYGEDLLMLFFKSFLVILAAMLLTVGNVLYQKFVSHTAIAGWFSTVFIGLANLAVACFGFFVLGLLLIHLNNKNPNARVPVYQLYPDDSEKNNP